MKSERLGLTSLLGLEPKIIPTSVVLSLFDKNTREGIACILANFTRYCPYGDCKGLAKASSWFNETRKITEILRPCYLLSYYSRPSVRLQLAVLAVKMAVADA